MGGGIRPLWATSLGRFFAYLAEGRALAGSQTRYSSSRLSRQFLPSIIRSLRTLNDQYRSCLFATLLFLTNLCLCKSAFAVVLPGPIEQQLLSLTSVSFDYVTEETSERTITVPTFDNNRGTLYRIDWSFSGTSSHVGTASWGPTPSGGLLAIQDTLLTLRLNPQNGPDVPFPERIDVTVTCPPDLPVCPAGAAPRIYSDPSDFNLSWEPAAKSFIKSAGGPVRVEIATSVIPGTGTVSGTTTVSGTLNVTYTYDARTPAEYAYAILDLVNQATATGVIAQTEVQRAELFYQYAIQTRERDLFGTSTASSVNENIKEVEYVGRGIHGGLLRATGTPNSDDRNDFMNRWIPISGPGYDICKRLGVFPSICGPENRLPQAEPGGMLNAIYGWLNGLRGLTLKEAVDRHFGSSPLPPLPPQTPQGTPGQPTLPEIRENIPSSGGRTAVASLFPLNIQDSAGIYYFDPGVASDYLISLGGLFIDGFVVPDYDGIIDVFSLLVRDLTFDVNEGQYFDFAGFGLSSVDAFGLRGVTPDLDHFVIGLKFDRNGVGALGIVERAQSVSEPSALALVVIAFLGIRLSRAAHKEVSRRRSNPRFGARVTPTSTWSSWR